MKKLLTVLAASAFVFALASCGSTPKTEKTSEPAAPAAETASTETTEKAEEEKAAYVPYEPTGEIEVLDDFEEGLYWTFVGDTWGDGDCSTDITDSTEWASEGSTSLKCTFKDGKTGAWEKAGFICEGGSLLDQDWSGAKMVLFDVYNPNSFDIDVMFVTQAGENWDAWNQTGAFTCPAGEVTPVYFLIQYHKNMDVINRAIIYKCGNGNDGCMYIDNFRIER